MVNDHSDGEQESKILLVGTRNSALFSGAYGALHGALMGSDRPAAKLVVNGLEVKFELFYSIDLSDLKHNKFTNYYFDGNVAEVQ